MKLCSIHVVGRHVEFPCELIHETIQFCYGSLRQAKIFTSGAVFFLCTESDEPIRKSFLLTLMLDRGFGVIVIMFLENEFNLIIRLEEI